MQPVIHEDPMDMVLKCRRSFPFQSRKVPSLVKNNGGMFHNDSILKEHEYI